MKKRLEQMSWADFIKPAMLILFAVFILFKAPVFFTLENLTSVLSQGVVIGIASIGMSMVIFAGEIDISLGGIIYLSGVIATQIYMNTKSLPLALLSAVAVGGLCGAVNGIGVAKLKIPSLITTLAVSNVTIGIGSLLMGKEDIYVAGDPYKVLSQTKILGITSGVWIYFLLVAIFIIVIRKTKFGRYIYAKGDNADALRSTGINVDIVVIFIFVLTGLLCGVAGILATSRLGGSVMLLSVGTELYCIAAVVVGGASMLGGRGNILGSVVGAFIVVALDNLLRLMKVNAYLYDVVWGAVIFLVVLIDILKTMQKVWQAERSLPAHVKKG